MTKKLDDIIHGLFSDMSFEDQLKFVDSLGKSRRMMKQTSKPVVKAKKAKAQLVDKLDALFSQLTPEERAKFLAK